jgi:hypothetical protein
LTIWEGLQVATVTTLLAQSLIYQRTGKAQNSKNCEKNTMNAPNAITSATYSIRSTEAPAVIYHLQGTNGKTRSYFSNKRAMDTIANATRQLSELGLFV